VAIDEQAKGGLVAAGGLPDQRRVIRLHLGG
jgi:hypothetical protein